MLILDVAVTSTNTRTIYRNCFKSFNSSDTFPGLILLTFLYVTKNNFLIFVSDRLHEEGCGRISKEPKV